MGWFDRAFGRTPPPGFEGDRLRKAVFEAAVRIDPAEFLSLAKAHRERILAEFPSWKKVPTSLRSKPSQMQVYAQGLIRTAELFDGLLGTPALLESLKGGSGSNPLVAWEDSLRRATQLLEAGDFVAAVPELERCLEVSKGLTGPGAERLLVPTHEHLAVALFHLGSVDRALPHAGIALSMCERSGDAEGVVACLSMVYDLQRYAGRPAGAADAAEAISSVCRNMGDADGQARWEKQAALVRRGEPLLRVVASIGGAELEIEALDAVPVGKVRFVYARNRLTLRPSGRAFNEGQQSYRGGRMTEALERLDTAIGADPFNPAPHRLKGLILLRSGEFAASVAALRRAEQLAPGWYSVRSDIWLAEEAAARRVPRDVVQDILDADADDTSRDDRERLGLSITARMPSLAVGWLLLARALRDKPDPVAAEAALRRGLSCDPDPDVASRLAVDLAATVETVAEQRPLLAAARAPGGNLTAAAMAALMLLPTKSA